MEEYMLPCFSKSLFGVECLGCGTQRSLLLLFQGDFIGAFKMYPAIYTTLLFFIFLFIHLIDKSRNYTKIVITTAILNAIIMIVAYYFKHFY
ncbi:DUF2752 domain-containing protein [Flavobacterium sp. HNIBRBA15423]|uniref:DUF2752 domain-containing protein n=1 Tax=Flavobacterium sp. HNIBRBA15423 TaxID=3458683 RepID=UPI004044AD8E